MGLRSRLRGDKYMEGAYAQATADEQRALPRPENELPLLGAYTASNITPTAALAIADVWAAVRVLADAASSLPLHVYRKTTDGRERVTSGKLVDLLDRPASATTQADLVSTLMAHLLIYGAAYVGKYREDGEVRQLGLLHHDQVLKRRVLREALHPLERDPRLIPRRRTDRHSGTGHGQEVVQPDLRSQRRLQIPARQDRVHLALAAEMRPRDPLLVRFQRLSDHFRQRDETPVARLHDRRDLSERGHHRSSLCVPLLGGLCGRFSQKRGVIASRRRCSSGDTAGARPGR